MVSARQVQITSGIIPLFLYPCKGDLCAQAMLFPPLLIARKVRQFLEQSNESDSGIEAYLPLGLQNSLVTAPVHFLATSLSLLLWDTFRVRVVRKDSLLHWQGIPEVFHQFCRL